MVPGMDLRSEMSEKFVKVITFQIHSCVLLMTITSHSVLYNLHDRNSFIKQC
jgi:hypothetical protein